MSRPITLITGASSGIGKAFAERFAKQGHDLILVARRRAEMEALGEHLKSQHPTTVHVVAMDLATPTAADDLFARVAELGLVVDNLINNAGVGLHGAFDVADAAALDRMVILNVQLLTKLTRLFLPAMLERKRGAILNVASTAAFQPVPYMAAYAATKAYVLSFSEGLAEEIRDRGVKVVALCPGPTRTEFVETANLKADLMRFANWMTADQVADAGMEALRTGEVVKVAGAINAAGAAFVRFVPRSVISKVVGRVFRPSATH